VVSPCGNFIGVYIIVLNDWFIVRCLVWMPSASVSNNKKYFWFSSVRRCIFQSGFGSQEA